MQRGGRRRHKRQWVDWIRIFSLRKCLSNDSWRTVDVNGEMCWENKQAVINNHRSWQKHCDCLQYNFILLSFHMLSANRPWGRICTESIKVWRGEKIWHNSNQNLFVVFESVWHSNSRRILYEHFYVASFKSLYRRLAFAVDWNQWRLWCMCAIKSVVFKLLVAARRCS